MKATGIVRRIDDLGRVVIPKELRRHLAIDEGDPIEIFVEDDYVMLKKYYPVCVFCGEAKKIDNFKGKNICAKCKKELKEEI